jgi:hypothetical protein
MKMLSFSNVVIYKTFQFWSFGVVDPVLVSALNQIFWIRKDKTPKISG